MIPFKKKITNPHTTNMLDTTVTGDENSKSFTNPRKKSQVYFRSNPSTINVSVLQCQHDIPQKMTYKKTPTPGKQYCCF